MTGITSISGSGSDRMVQSLAAMAQQLLRQQRTNQVKQAPQTVQDGDGDNDASTGSTQAADSAARQTFFKLLMDNGIAPEQFRNDLLTAIQNSENGQVDRGTALQSLSAGLTVDAMA